MKNIFQYTFPLLFLAGVVACNDIAEDDRWKYTETITLTDTSKFARNVLIEDFTGQTCINCPNAADVIDTLQQQFNTDSTQRIIAVAIHGGSKSIPTTSPLGLATQQGKDYHTFWNVTLWPSGLINRKGGLLLHTEWKTQAMSYLSQESEFALEGDAFISFDTLYVQVKALRNLTINQQSPIVKMGIWVTEDSIVKPQMMPEEKGGGTKKDYLHKHVFRKSLTNMIGEEIHIDELGRFDAMMACPLDSVWNKKQLHPVVFVTNGSEVLQVISLHAEIIN